MSKVNKSHDSSPAKELIKFIFAALILLAGLIFSIYNMFNSTVYSFSGSERDKRITMAKIFEATDSSVTDIFLIRMNDDNQRFSYIVMCIIVIVTFISALTALLSVFGMISGKKKRAVTVLLSFALMIQCVGHAAVFALGLLIVDHMNSVFEDSIKIGLFPVFMVIVCAVFGTAGFIISKKFIND